jgi:glycosyltransferase involved in cell wall biosynthesis
LVGDGPQREELTHCCRERKIDGVRFAGAVDCDAVALYYKCADVLVMPTLEDNWSLVVPEAMACGLPILCSRYNGCWPELVTPANGWVFDPLVSSDFVRVLIETAQSKTRLAQMGEASRRIVSTHTASDAAAAIYEATRLACRRRRAGRCCLPGVPAGAWVGLDHRPEEQD